MDYEDKQANDVLKQIKNLQKTGELITYVGRNIIGHLQIQSFNTQHPNTNYLGADFDMTLKEVFFVKNAYPSSSSATAESATIKETTAAGTQQITQGDNKDIYHTVKKGDTVYGLANTTYKSLGSSVAVIMNNNPDAFSKKGDPRTLKVGANLWMGTRK